MWKLAVLWSKHVGRETNIKIPAWHRVAVCNSEWVLSLSAGKYGSQENFLRVDPRESTAALGPVLPPIKLKIKGFCIISSQHIAPWQEQTFRLLGVMMKSFTDEITSQLQCPPSIGGSQSPEVWCTLYLLFKCREKTWLKAAYIILGICCLCDYWYSTEP